MSQSIATEKVGQRIYVTGGSYAIKDRLKAAGCHWDGDRRQWWIGAAKAAAIEAILDHGDDTPAPAKVKSIDDARVHAKVEYKGRSYYCLATTHDGAKHRLATLDGSVDFWADSGACKIVRTYQPREVFRGYGRGGRRTEYTTIGSIRRFIEQQKNPETRRGQCTECGAWGPSGESCPECGGEGSYI